VIEAGDALQLEQSLLAPLQRQPAAKPPLELALALPRRDVELVWRMATELGIDRLQPLVAHRCVERGQAPLERWRSVVAEASEQCERLWMPVLEPPRQALAWLAERPGSDAPIAASSRRRFLATTRRENLQLLPQALGFLAPGEEAVTVAVGPEGGWTPEEEGAAAAAGWCPVSLGPLILRSGTAAVAAAVQLASWRSRSS
jgi:16S rRNA (uracil1498-N3)-methyltransferase